MLKVDENKVARKKDSGRDALHIYSRLAHHSSTCFTLNTHRQFSRIIFNANKVRITQSTRPPTERPSLQELHCSIRAPTLQCVLPMNTGE